MNDINSFNDIDKLRNLDPKDFLTDDEKNQIRSREIREINTPNSRTKVLVIPTDEEYEIASQVYHLLEN